MRNLLFTLFVFAFSSGSIFAQGAKNWKKYYAVPTSAKELIFYDDFDDNRNSWVAFPNRRVKTDIKNGKLIIASKGNPIRVVSKKSKVSEPANFEVELRVLIRRGEKEILGSIINGVNTKLLPKLNKNKKKFKGSRQLKQKKHFLLLTLRKLNDNFYWFVNQQFVKKQKAQGLVVDFFGFALPAKSTVVIDYVKVFRLKGKPKQKKIKKEVVKENIAPQITIFEPQENARGFTVVKENRQIKVSGKVTDSDGIKQLRVNNLSVNVDENGEFKTIISLESGIYIINVVATDKLNLSATKKIQLQKQQQTIVSDTNKTSEKRLALVIGNSQYEHSPKLKNPVNDADAMAAVLKKLGFDVLIYKNIDQKAMKRAIDEFGEKLGNYTVGLFFYAGHGVQVNGNNYLIPTDAQWANERDVEYDGVDAERVLAKMESAECQTNIVILDACRDNPFKANRGGADGGLAFMNAPSGSLIAYSTAPGSIAADGSGKNGLYTSALLKVLPEKGLSISQMFYKVRFEVMEKSGKQQIPWESTSLVNDFYFTK